MKIVLAADGSPYTKKALAFLVTHEALASGADEVIVVQVQPPVTPRVKAMLGAATVQAYNREEAEKVLAPIGKFLARHKITFKTTWSVGSPSTEIVKVAVKEGAHMIVMGTHGHGWLGRAIMGSVAQRVVAEADIPVLLVK